MVLVEVAIAVSKVVEGSTIVSKVFLSKGIILSYNTLDLIKFP